MKKHDELNYGVEQRQQSMLVRLIDSLTKRSGRDLTKQEREYAEMAALSGRSVKRGMRKASSPNKVGTAAFSGRSRREAKQHGVTRGVE